VRRRRGKGSVEGSEPGPLRPPAMFNNRSHEMPPSDRPYDRPRNFLMDAEREEARAGAEPGRRRRRWRKPFGRIVRGVGKSRLFFLEKRINARVSRLTRISLRGSRSRCMANDDSEQIAAARRRGRPHAATEASGASRCAKSSFGPIVNRQSRKSGDRRCDGQRNFPACNALKTHKMAKESRFLASQSGIPAKRPSPISRCGARSDCRSRSRPSRRAEYQGASMAGSIAIADRQGAPTPIGKLFRECRSRR
jgi:hypothetical protein